MDTAVQTVVGPAAGYPPFAIVTTGNLDDFRTEPPFPTTSDPGAEST